MGATTVAAALSDFQAISQTVGTLKGGTVGADNLDDELSSDLESQEAVVDKPVTAIVIGAGARGRTYASYSEHYPNSLKIVGVADINTERKEYMKNLYRIPDEHCFSDWKEVFNVPKFADAVIIATPDNLHYEPALKAMAAGYDLLLEKPVAQSIKECTDILKYAKRYDRIVGICHVLRYAPYFIALKRYWIRVKSVSWSAYNIWNVFVITTWPIPMYEETGKARRTRLPSLSRNRATIWI